MIQVIINPAAGRGRGRHKRPSIEAALSGQRDVKITETTAPGEEAQLASMAIRDGAGRIIVVGGDGTCGRVAETLVQSNSSCALAVIPCGTGNDFAKTLGLRQLSVSQIVHLVSHGTVTPIDVGRAAGHYFINSCGFGFDASVLEASNGIRFLNGDAVYIYSALAQLLTYRGVDIGVDRRKPLHMLMAIVSVGQFLGGAFRIAPAASVVDGKLDVAFFEDGNVFQRLRMFAGAMRGTHLRLASVRAAKREKLTLEFATPPAIEMDGELRLAKTTSIDVECVPRALSVVAAPGVVT